MKPETPEASKMADNQNNKEEAPKVGASHETSEKVNAKREKQTEEDKSALDPNKATKKEIDKLNDFLRKAQLGKSIIEKYDDGNENEEFLNKVIKGMLVNEFKDKYNYDQLEDDNNNYNNNSRIPTAKDCSGLELFIYYSTKAITDLKHFIDEHRMKIGYA